MLGLECLQLEVNPAIDKNSSSEKSNAFTSAQTVSHLRLGRSSFSILLIVLSLTPLILLRSCKDRPADSRCAFIICGILHILITVFILPQLLRFVNIYLIFAANRQRIYNRFFWTSAFLCSMCLDHKGCTVSVFR